MARHIYSKERNWLSARLVQAREEAGLTQSDVTVTGIITQSKLSKLENGQQTLDVLLLKKLAQVYGKPITFFTTPEAVRVEIDRNWSQQVEPCQLSGCTVVELLRTVFLPIDSERNTEEARTCFLRADIALLFESGHLQIDPESNKIQISAMAERNGYGKYAGMQLPD